LNVDGPLAKLLSPDLLPRAEEKGLAEPPPKRLPDRPPKPPLPLLPPKPPPRADFAPSPPNGESVPAEAANGEGPVGFGVATFPELRPANGLAESEVLPRAPNGESADLAKLLKPEALNASSDVVFSSVGASFPPSDANGEAAEVLPNAEPGGS